MSARAILSEGLTITERDMPYHEREGRSKLRVARDGLRFLDVILRAALLYRPSRPLGIAGVACLAVAVALMLTPTASYFERGSVDGWMIYRFVVSDLAGTVGWLLLCAAYLTKKIVWVTLGGRNRKARKTPLEVIFSSRWFWLLPFACVAAGGLLVLPSFVELVATGATYEHWSRFIAMSFLLSIAAITAVTRAVDYCFELIADRLDFLEDLGER
jgi:hypothetical protein